MNTEFPPIFIISLKGSPRRAFISQRLTERGFKFQFFDATYGKALNENELKKIDFNFYPENFNAKKPLTLGEIGCAISHIKLYEYIVKNNIKEAIILEDDAIISLDFPNILSECLKKVSNKKEIIFFDPGKAKKYPLSKKLPEYYRLVKFIKPRKKSKHCIYKLTGYLITFNGCEKLLKHAYPIRMPADLLTGLLQLNNLNAYGIIPPCIFGASCSEIDKIEDRMVHDIKK